MKRQFWATILVSCLALPALGANDASCEGEESKSRPKLQQELDLSHNQREQVKALRDKYGKLIEAKRKELRAAKSDLGSSLQSPEKGSAYRDKLMQKFKRVQSLRGELMQSRFEMALEIRELLSAEQISKFKAMNRLRVKGGADPTEGFE